MNSPRPVFRRSTSWIGRWSAAVAVTVVAAASLVASPAGAAEPLGDGTVALPSGSGVDAVAVPVTGPDARSLASPRIAVESDRGRTTTVAAPGFEAKVTVPDGQMIALEWRGAPVGAVELRTRTDGAWGSWVELEADPDSGPDPTSPDFSAGGPTSVGPVWTGSGTDAVHLKVTSGQLASLRVVVLNSPGGETPSSPRATVTSTGKASMPAISPRSAWGAGPWRCGGTPATSPLKNAIMHHTASGNTYSQTEVDDALRSIYYYHTVNLGWCDIAYNVLVDRFGGMWEGRTGSLSGTVIGGHAKGFNTGSVGVSALGNYDGVALPSATFTGIRKVLAWRLGGAGLDPKSSVTIQSLGSTKYASGVMVTLPRISGHRDTSLTACPGTNIYNRLGELRNLVATDVAAPPSGSPAAPVGAWAIAGDRQAHVMWPQVTAPTRPVSGYVVTTSPGGRRTLVAAVNNRVYLPNLTNGVALRFTVATVDSTGIGPDSLATTSVTPTSVAPFSSTDAFVRQVYADFMRRAPSASELSTARSSIDNGGIPRAQILESVMRNTTWAGVHEPVARLYFAYFRRVPDSSGLEYWVGRFRGGESLSSISGHFAASAEFRAAYGSLSNEQFVRLLYVNVLGRQPDPAGVWHWTSQLSSGRTRGYVMIGFSESAEHRARLRTEMDVIILWQGTLGEMPTPARFATTVARLDTGATLGTVTEELLIDPIYVARIKR